MLAPRPKKSKVFYAILEIALVNGIVLLDDHHLHRKVHYECVSIVIVKFHGVELFDTDFMNVCDWSCSVLKPFLIDLHFIV